MMDPFLSTSYSPAYTEVDDDPREVEYIEIKVKSALHHTRLPYGPKPFYYSLNLYRGCRHGCPFCFARYTHWFLGFQNSFDFQRKIQVKVNLLEVLGQELNQAPPKEGLGEPGRRHRPLPAGGEKIRIGPGGLQALGESTPGPRSSPPNRTWS